MTQGKRLVEPLLAGLLAFAAPTICRGDFYYSLDSTVAIIQSNRHVTIQSDTSGSHPRTSSIFSSHSCLDSNVSVKDIGRGFSVFGIAEGWSYSTVDSVLSTDPTVNRCIPVYAFAVDSVEFPVTDLISVQFKEDISNDSALHILATLGLHYVDSLTVRHMYWHAALDDTIKESPLTYANSLHSFGGTEWATPTMYIRPRLRGLPSDPYFANQYYLRNTGQSGGAVDCDIDADSAWLFALADSNLKVAVIDEGCEAHPELRTDGFSLGYDFADVDNDPSPGVFENHGMACTGILAGLHNGTGIAGVDGGCKVVPIKIFSDYGEGALPDSVAAAIIYVNSKQIRVASCSWGYGTTAPITAVEVAIHKVSNQCGGSEKTTEAGLGTAMVFAAGEDGTDPLEFPANMPEVIAVGAINKSNQRWGWCNKSTTMVVAPTGDTSFSGGDVWTIDMTGNYGWNPGFTGPDDAGGDIDYTSSFGGTSAACPQVAGIVALLLSRSSRIRLCNPAADALDILAHSADDLGAPGNDADFGYGRANAYKAVAAISHGDMNGDAVINVVDVVGLIGVAFRGADPPTLFRGLPDVNCDGFTDVLDVVGVIGIAFRGAGPASTCYRYNY
ncbi:MAG: S8 family serine peptidase [candidate division Zixibacteria bacterium]|nr:S8 family serine peptidase [candidate division Zixibacteria bacterium]